jgi:hypothetical protein
MSMGRTAVRPFRGSAEAQLPPDASALQKRWRAAPLAHTVGEGLGVRATKKRKRPADPLTFEVKVWYTIAEHRLPPMLATPGHPERRILI